MAGAGPEDAREVLGDVDELPISISTLDFVTKTDALEEVAAQETGERRMVSKELSTELDPLLLRGVPLHRALANFGRHFENPDSGMFNVDPANYKLSRTTEDYDAFLSHDWVSSRALKLLALLIVFNSAPAFYTALLSSMLVGLLRGYGALPDQLWTTLLVHVSFLSVLLFWQRLRAFLCLQTVIFMDKLCIAQHDEELKQKGILGLPGFLLKSKRLVVLWTPRYFRRLWCSFEIATFLKDPENWNSIQFMPLKTGALLFLNTLCWHVLSLGYRIIMDPQEQMSHQMMSIPGGLTFAFCAVILPMVSYVGLALTREVEELPKQLSEFRIEDAECYCCSNNHQHPHTKAPLPCDRRIVHKMLKKWYGRLGTGGDYLGGFNALVQNQLAPSLISGMGGSTLPFRYTVYMVSSCNLPYLSIYVAKWVQQVQSGQLSALPLLVWSLRNFMDWSIASIAVVFAARISLSLWKRGLRWRCDRLVVILLAPWVLLCVSGLWGPFAVTLMRTDADSLLPAVPYLSALAITLYLFSPGCCQTRRKDQAADVARSSERTEGPAFAAPAATFQV